MDVGYGLTLTPEGTTTTGDMTGEDVANLALFSAGVGYRFSNKLRADLTVDYRTNAEFDATTPGGARQLRLWPGGDAERLLRHWNV